MSNQVATIRDNIVRVPVERIFPNVWNPNQQSDFIYEKERTSIRTHGFLLPILVREIPEGFEIIDGEHRWKAAQAEGLTEIPANNLGRVSDSVAMQLTIIMNETRGHAERTKLSELMQKLAAEVPLETLTTNLPYQPAEIQALLQKVDWDSVSADMNNGAQDAPGGSQGEDFREIKLRLPEGVADQFEGQLERFKRALYPGADPEEVSPVMAIEAMTQHLAQIPDEQLV